MIIRKSVGHGETLLYDTEDFGVIGHVFMTLKDGGAHLINLAIDEEHRRRGHGTQFCKEITELATVLSLSHIRLDVFASNKSAIRMYERAGFEAQPMGFWAATSIVPTMEMIWLAPGYKLAHGGAL
jgi:ribosomal-protein-alanine N-acetyltransferase